MIQQNSKTIKINIIFELVIRRGVKWEGGWTEIGEVK